MERFLWKGESKRERQLHTELHQTEEKELVIIGGKSKWTM